MVIFAVVLPIENFKFEWLVVVSRGTFFFKTLIFFWLLSEKSAKYSEINRQAYLRIKLF